MADLLNPISDQTLADYDRLREECGLLQLSSVGLVELRGEDRKGWLQGQVTNDVRRLEPGNSSSFCLCSATGQIQAVVDAWAISDRILLTCAQETVPAVMQRVEQMVVLEDVEASEGTEYRLLSIQGPLATRRLSEHVELPNLDAGEAKIGEISVWCLRSDRTGSGGWDLWIPREGDEAIALLEKSFAPVGREAYQIARLEAGIPLYGADISPRNFPKELGPAFEAKHVNYRKGCYMGQEVLMRMHSRGHANRTWMNLTAEDALEIGALVAHPRRADAGMVTSVAYSPEYGHIGTAMIRSEVAEDREEVRVITERGDVLAELRPAPLRRLV